MLSLSAGAPIRATFETVGEPISLQDAEALAAADKYQFQWWALRLVNARPVEEKKGMDQEIDGRIYFHDEGAGGPTKQIILSVKRGHVDVKDVRELHSVVKREKAAIGVLICVAEKTRRVARVRANYPEWWLVLVDQIGHADLNEVELQHVRAVFEVEEPWRKIHPGGPKLPHASDQSVSRERQLAPVAMVAQAAGRNCAESRTRARTTNPMTDRSRRRRIRTTPANRWRSR